MKKDYRHKKPWRIRTPVLFLVFNRLDTTKKVFGEIKKAKPKKLFVAADGPRTKDEKKKTDAVRQYILDNVDWDCDLKTLFREKNLGCKYAVSGAIDWFFKNVEQGIILEDDCLPSQSFFRFCEELLEKYKYDERIMQISGTNFIQEKTAELNESYFFSKMPYIWGWATWRRAWKFYDVSFNKIVPYSASSNFLDYLMHNKKVLDLQKINTWDVQWFSLCKINGLTVIPKKNLIANIGFGEDSTHEMTNNVDKSFLQKERKEMGFPLIHPKKISWYKKFDCRFVTRDLWRILLKKLSSLFEIFRWRE